MACRTLHPGEPGPWFYTRSLQNPKFCFDTMAGRYVVLTCIGSAARPDVQDFLAALESFRYQLDDRNACLFLVTTDPQDEARVADRLPGIRFFFDTDFTVSKLYGAADLESPATLPYVRQSVVLDERLRVVRIIPWDVNPAAHALEISQTLVALGDFDAPRLGGTPAPVLVVPRVFEPELCRILIELYERQGGRESGFMRDVGGKTVEILDPNHKVRRDAEIDDEGLRRACMTRIHDRVVPEILKAFQFRATRIERYIVACYEAETAGHFRAHRDNTTKGTAHRRFAVSLNLNTGEFDGGAVWFPEYTRQYYLPPAGGAVVFSCSLLHEATPVTRGKRYVFLPFLYDDAAAQIRQQNLQYLG